jgi:hypothetical protein
MPPWKHNEKAACLGGSAAASIGSHGRMRLDFGARAQIFQPEVVAVASFRTVGSFLIPPAFSLAAKYSHASSTYV